MTLSRNLANFGNIVGGLIGEVKMWATGTAPTGYLLCNGSAVSRTTYSSLFAALGTIYGVGDGSTTFNLPNFQDRMPIGAGSTYSANTTGGSKDAIVVSHTHTATDAGHTHGYTVWFDQGGNHTQYGSDVTQPVVGGTTKTSASANANITVSSTGATGTNANLPPYIGIHFIIRYQ